MQPVAELVGVTQRYGAVTALDGMNLALAPGRVTALLGPNGAGKTTALKLMLGLVQPQAGRVQLFGADPWTRAARQRVGVMLQVSGVPPTLTVREHLRLFSSYYPAPLSLDEALCAAGADGFADRRFGQLSGGQQQRALFALALCGRPDLLCLDEPTVGLDVEARRALWRAVREQTARGCAVLLTTHHLEEADALADRIVVVQRGRIVADGTPAAIKQRVAARRLRCVTATPVNEVQRWPGVQRAVVDRDGLVVFTGEAEQVVRALLARDPGLRDLEVHPAGLEEAFIALTTSTPIHPAIAAEA